MGHTDAQHLGASDRGVLGHQARASPGSSHRGHDLPRAGQPTGFRERSWLLADLQLHQGIRRVTFAVPSTCEGRELSRWKPGSSYHSFSFSIVLNNFKIVWGGGKRWDGRERARVRSELKVDALGEPRTPGWGGELRPLNRST